MPYDRVRIDLAFFQPLSIAASTALANLKAEVVKAKAYAVKINDGKINEEDTTKGKEHVCKHDLGLACDPETDIK